MIYLDNNATTPTDTRIVKSIVKYFSEEYGNPHSTTHIKGISANLDIEKYRKIIADYFNVMTEGVVFTSGATESNNIAIMGYLQNALEKKTTKRKILCSPVEHKCILECFNAAKELGFNPIFLKVDSNGVLDLDFFKKTIDDDTLLVSIMGTNNETGVDFQVEKIGEICSRYGVFFHTDLAQSLNHSSFDLFEGNIDTASISGHKIYGPKGIGALICKNNPEGILKPQMLGGYQEAGLRSGTLPTHLCVGLGEAVKILSTEKEKYYKHSLGLKNKLWSLLKNSITGLEQNTDNTNHPGMLNLYFPNIDAEMLCMQLANKVAVSTSAACNSIEYKYSYVLKAMGFEEDRAKSSIRLCVGRQNTEDEIHEASKLITASYNKLVE